MRRRIQVPNELPDNSHFYNPRKLRSYGAPGFFTNSSTYLPTLGPLDLISQEENKHRHYIPESPNTVPKKFALNYSWLNAQIGKVYIPVGYLPGNPSKNNWVSEKEIAIYAKPYDFNILYENRSKPMADLQPSRLNIVLDLNNVIRNVYFG